MAFNKSKRRKTWNFMQPTSERKKSSLFKIHCRPSKWRFLQQSIRRNQLKKRNEIQCFFLRKRSWLLKRRFTNSCYKKWKIFCRINCKIYYCSKWRTKRLRRHGWKLCFKKMEKIYNRINSNRRRARSKIWNHLNRKRLCWIWFNFYDSRRRCCRHF